ncbi:DUF6473 family protein [uncultured Tateyamaria sp.]|uniref:DUF6473 family protein n=1 Tax=uncultured Tateyamaria sp. TaxID=455651 RepID=UPI002632FE45|nr:DUF6473 family protein [uncultured Tateyamaria sp.]
MSIESLGPGGLDYLPCRYGNSKVLFRGPRRSLDAPFVAFFGGSATYGKFVRTPFPDLVEQSLGTTCVNFGSLNGGVDVFATDPYLREVSGMAQTTVIQITSPRNMSNRFYRVHPRRNDRFVEASSLLRAIYREVDFAEFNFTNHMLSRLHLVSPERFQTVVEELQMAWVARMRLVLSQIPGRTVLLWAGCHAPEEAANDLDSDLGLVSRDMVNKVSELATEYVEAVMSEDAVKAGTEGMVFGEMDAPAAKTMLGPVAHREIAQALVSVLN